MYICTYICIYIYIFIHIHITFGSVSPNTVLRHQDQTAPRTTMCVIASTWCTRKVKDSIIVIRARRRTLCTGPICSFFSCLPMFVCLKLHICIHAQTFASVTTPSPHPHSKVVLLNASEQTLRQYRTQRIEGKGKRNREIRRERGEGVEI